jgi:hypothetical protein
VADGSLSDHVEMPSDPADAALLDEMYRRYVHMVLYARAGAGSWSDDDQLTSFRIYLDEPVTVRINDEPQGWTMPQVRRDIAPGETVELTDVASSQVPLPDADGSPYFAASVADNRWTVSMELRTTVPKARALLGVAEEFTRAAQTALDAGALRAFTENAFHAAESLAKAELLAFPISASEVEGFRKHSAVQSAYDMWARLENTDKRFPALLRELQQLRTAATYAEGEFALTRADAEMQLAVIAELSAHARDVVASVRGRVIKIIATRPLEAGEPVYEGDATIRPRR